MNYLAHLRLAPDNPESRIGNLLGDFLKPSQAGHLPATMQAGMQLHRQIDRFTDDHPIVRQSKQRISAERRRYAGILVDIFYDHFLARHWAQFSTEPLPAFCQQVYLELRLLEPLLPPRLQRILPDMEQDNWLLAYGDMAGIDRVLRGFSAHRISRPNPVAGGIVELVNAYGQLEADFLMFYPDLQAFVARNE